MRALGLVLVVASCSNVVSPSLVKVRASADFQCGKEQVQVKQLGDTTWSASGCGKTAAYTCWTSVGMGEGTCVREGEGPTQAP